MQLIGVKYNPWPQLRLEYMCGGTLEDQGDIPVDECVRILCQCLSALVYLHECKGIVHRDIKQGNILVEYLDTGNIYKFADFGLSRESRDPTTICGSWPYLAPELIKESDRRQANRIKKRSYTSAVDIWSLGVVVFECAHDLPRPKSVGTWLWCEEIVKKLNKDLQKKPDGLKQLLSTTMVIIDPDLRCSAQDCYDRAWRLAAATDDRSQTPTLSSYAPKLQNHAANKDDDDQKTVIYQRASLINDSNKPSSSLDDYSTASTEIKRYVRSSYPPPDSHVPTPATTRKRATRVSKSSSSSGGHQVKSRRKTAPSSSRGYQKESKSDAGYYHENWLRDPLCVGSSVAALGQEMPDWSSSAAQTPGRYDRRTELKPLDEQKNESSGPVLQEWLEEPNGAEPLQWNLPMTVPSCKEYGYDYRSAFRDGTASVPGTYLTDPAQVLGEGRQILDGAWNDSEACMAANLLQAMRQAS